MGKNLIKHPPNAKLRKSFRGPSACRIPYMPPVRQRLISRHVNLISQRTRRISIRPPKLNRMTMSSETSSIPQTGDAEAKMRRSLGLDTASNPGPAPSSPTDPLRGARQAIRSQAIAREYVERQLAHAEATVQDLRNKLNRARQEKDAAVEAARSATAMRLSVQRALITTEAALAAEKTARDRGDRALREAQATINHLQAKLDTAAQGLETAKAELAAERQARQKAEDALREAKDTQQVAAPDSREEAAALTIRRPVGRLRKMVALQPVSEAGSPLETSKAIMAQAIGVAAVVPPAPRSVPRPRKIESVAPVPASTKPVRTARAPMKATSEKVNQSKPKTSRPSANDQEPVQWWVKGWDRRGR
jgi:hypothetical protein